MSAATLGAMGVAAVSWLLAPWELTETLLFSLLLLCTSLSGASTSSVPLPRGLRASLGRVAELSALLLLGPLAAVVLALTGAWARTLSRGPGRTEWRAVLLMLRGSIAMGAGSAVFVALGGSASLVVEEAGTTVVPLLSAAMVAAVVRAAGTIIGAPTHTLSYRRWSQALASALVVHVIAALIALASHWLLIDGGMTVPLLLLVPFAVTYLTCTSIRDRLDVERRRTQETVQVHLSALEALAVAIDAKDQSAHTHIRRVQHYAAALARAFGLPDSEVHGVRTAALLHDIGKLAIPEHILSKPGALTAEEFRKVRVHPQVGADIISAVPFPYPVAPLILAHHERWDGKGYPLALSGDAIPLGARIITAVDYFDALTSDRPYHKAMSHEAAVALLRQEAGHALDPAVVQMFVRLLPALRHETHALQDLPGGAAAAPSRHDAAPASERTAVFAEIADAHREIYALYDVARTMGTSLGLADTMTQTAAKIRGLVPFSSCALFLFDGEGDLLRCRFATGVEADRFHDLVVRGGHGLNGWVARNGRTLIHAHPSADFEAAGSASAPTVLQSAVVAPLFWNERLVGTLAVYHEVADFYSPDHRRLLQQVCEQAAAIIHNAVVFEQTQEDSLTDPLTGLPNTRFMLLHLERELARAQRLQSEVSLLVMDLDRFKDINDTHGHAVGDSALREVAKVVRAAIRPYDLCVRYAGDEFILVLSSCSAEEAEQKRNELQHAVDQLTIEVRPGRHVMLGASVGAATYPHDATSYETLLSTADSRMYREKSRRKQQRQQGATGTDGRTLSLVAAGLPDERTLSSVAETR